MSQREIHFLDLTIKVEGGNLNISTFFKSLDRNAYISKDSCHHQPWLDGVPKSQLLCIRGNCSKLAYFDVQYQVMSQRFREKGYDPSSLVSTLNLVRKMDREEQLVDKHAKNETNNFVLSLTTTSHVIKNIMQKHWHILQNDRVLGSLLPSKPSVIFRGVPSLKDKVAVL